MANAFSPNSGGANSDTSWPCWAKSNADATPPLPAPSTATRIPVLLVPMVGPTLVAIADQGPGVVRRRALVTRKVRGERLERERKSFPLAADVGVGEREERAHG